MSWRVGRLFFGKDQQQIASDPFLEKMASASPDELVANLARLLDRGAITTEQADGFYTVARRRKIVTDARNAVLQAADKVSLHNVRSVGQHRTAESEAEADEVRQAFVHAVDHLIAESQRAVVAKWRLLVVAGAVPSESSDRRHLDTSEYGSQAGSR